jgi:hypothetical protein
MPTWDELEPVEAESTPVAWDDLEPAEPEQDEKGRRRVELLGRMAEVERDRGAADQAATMLDWSERGLITPEQADVALAAAVPSLNTNPGLRQSMGGTASGLTSPINLLFAAATGGAGAIPRLGASVLRGVAGGFGFDMASHLPETATELGAAYGEATTPEERQRILADLGTAIALPAAALKGAIPRVGPAPVPPRLPGILSAEEAAANRAAVNNAAPGTVRPQEVMEWGPREIEAPARFELGEMPFEAAPRFGTTELPPVEVLPQSGRLGPIEILDRPAPLERETPGQPLPFWAEAPIIRLKTIHPEVTAAAEAARGVGLTKAAAAAEEAARGESRPAPYRPPVEFTAERAAAQERKAARASVEEGLTVPEIPMDPLAPDVGQFPEPPGMPTGTLSRLQRSRIQAGQPNVRTMQSNNPPAPPAPKPAAPPLSPEGFKSMEDAFEAGYARRSPEGIAELEALKAANTEAKTAARAAKDLNAFADLAQKGSKIDEAISMAKGDIAERKIAKDWLAQRELKDLPADAGTGKAYELGKSITTPEVLASTWERVKAEEARATELLEAATDDASIAAASEVGTRAGLLKESIEASHGMGAGMKFDKTKLTPEEYNARMASEVPLGEKPTPGVPQGTKGGVEAALEKLKISQEMGGDLRTNILKDIPVAVWNGAIDAAILAVKAGRTIADGVELAIREIKKQVNNFDEQRARDYFKTVLGEETKPGSGATKATPTTTKVPPTTTTPPVSTTAPASGTPPVPPAPPSVPTPPAPGAPAVPGAPAPGGRVTLDDVYKRFEVDPKPGTPIKERVGQAVEAFRTGMSSKFRPLNKLAEDIAKAYGVAKRDIAGIFEMLKGSSGKAEADIYRFDQAVAEPVKGLEKDFNAYMFLRRAIDRLDTDVATGETRRRGST